MGRYTPGMGHERRFPRTSGNGRPKRARECLLKVMSADRALARRTSGRACLLCPGISDINLLGYGESIIHLDAGVAYRALNRLASIKSPIIREVRGRDLFAGVELHRDYASAGAVATRLLQVGVLTKDTHRNTIRFAPSLIIDESQVDWAADRLVEVLEEVVKANTSV
jgi:hypothetical protein